MEPTGKVAGYDDPVTVTVPGGSITLDAAFVDADVEEIRRQARDYRVGARREFDLPVRFPNGFTGRVMGAMAAIPYGETRTYGEVAADLDTAPQPVGAACGRNPIPLIVPCHRVVAADGLGGFSAEGGTELKRRLLEHERAGTVQTTLGEDEWSGDDDAVRADSADTPVRAAADTAAANEHTDSERTANEHTDSERTANEQTANDRRHDSTDSEASRP